MALVDLTGNIHEVTADATVAPYVHFESVWTEEPTLWHPFLYGPGTPPPTVGIVYPVFR